MSFFKGQAKSDCGAVGSAGRLVVAVYANRVWQHGKTGAKNSTVGTIS
jgi:hypothetical protein